MIAGVLLFSMRIPSWTTDMWDIWIKRGYGDAGDRSGAEFRKCENGIVLSHPAGHPADSVYVPSFSVARTLLRVPEFLTQYFQLTGHRRLLRLQFLHHCR